MLRRTIPAVSFSCSHRALYLRQSRPLLGHDMHSSDRYKAAWDEMPFSVFHLARKDAWTWDWRVRFEFGLRDDYMLTKLRTYMMYCIPFYLIGMAATLYYPFLYLIWTDKPPPYLDRKGGLEHAKKYYGKEVWCADGKYRVGLYHINPPQLTATADEIHEMKKNGTF